MGTKVDSKGNHILGNWGICGSDCPKVEVPNIVESAVSRPEFSILLQAVTAAELVVTLSGDGPFTVFAPTNDAFAKIPANTLAQLLKPKNINKLKKLLLRHVVPKALESGDIPKGKTTLVTAGGEEITLINKNGITIKSSAGTATVIRPDYVVSNGIIHFVDTVL